MKKLIALLLAVSTMAISTSAFAADYTRIEVYVDTRGGASGVSRNYTASSNGSIDDAVVPTYGSPVFRNYSNNPAQLPTWRAGDIITLDIMAKNDGGTAIQIPNGTDITFISSLKDSTSYDNYTVQFIDQLVASNEGVSAHNYFTYKVRDNLVDGLYKVEIKVGDLAPAVFYYLIRTPEVELLYVNDSGQVWELDNGDAYCYGKATITGEPYSFTQSDAEIGFTLDDEPYTVAVVRNSSGAPTETFANAATASDAVNEINGTGEYFFRLVLEDVYTPGDPEAELDAYAKLPEVKVFLND